MSEFPECMKRRGGPEDEGDSMQRGLETQMNGQRCHRIVHHDGACIFDREPEFEPPRYPTNFRTSHSLKSGALLTFSKR